jgi:hypothetical protein
MAIQLNPEQERIVGQAIQAGLVPAPDDALEMGVAAVREILRTHGSSESLKAASDWSRELDTWIQSHSATEPPLSDKAIDRDAIYGDRGL